MDPQDPGKITALASSIFDPPEYKRYVATPEIKYEISYLVDAGTRVN
jgi:hypothetical protein